MEDKNRLFLLGVREGLLIMLSALDNNEFELSTVDVTLTYGEECKPFWELIAHELGWKEKNDTEGTGLSRVPPPVVALIHD